jgi:hypothetical protein
MKDAALKRISLMIREDQAQILAERGLNLSGLIRDLLDDYLSDHKITLSVSEETRAIYDKIISNTGSTDQDVEIYLRDSLKLLLHDKIQAMMKLESTVFGKSN